ncbi:MAG: hypothetical protein GY927_11535 [bacterium]|nr:hypothetical protein [bacterium]
MHEAMRFAVLISCLLLAGCSATTKQPAVQQFHILSVSVDSEDRDTSEETIEILTNSLLHNAAAYNAYRRDINIGYNLAVTINHIHYKNPMASLIVGDTNSIQTSIKVVDPATGVTIKEFRNLYIDGAGAVLNGVSGALLSVAVSNKVVDTKMMPIVAGRIVRKANDIKEIPVTIATQLKNTDVTKPFEGRVSHLSKQPLLESETPIND